MIPTNLVCEYNKNPVGLETEAPRFSWKFKSQTRNKYQIGYQILVADKRKLIEDNKGNMWDTGKRESDKSVNIVYQGSALESSKKYYWKVRIWDDEGEVSSYSSMATFEMGLLLSEDWEGKWITNKGESNPLFRKEINVEKDIKKARAYIAGLGYYELYINGNKAGEEVLNPGQTDYEQRVLYTTYDLTSLLKKEKNAVGIMLGNGRYSPTEEVVAKNPNELKKFGDNPLVIMQLEIEYCDGKKESIYTDESWKTCSGPIQSNDIYDGEVYDAREEKEGWKLSGYNDSAWKEAEAVEESPGGKLVSQTTCPVIKVNKTIHPQKMNSPRPGVFIYDFGQNFSGWVRIRGVGSRGDKVKIRYAEMLDEEGMLNTVPNRGAEAADEYIFKGEREEIYEPRFTYHGFRYVEITGYPGTPSLDSIEGRVVHTDVSKNGNFYCSNSLLNNIHNNILWGQLSNLMSIPTDCPQRDERMGWLGDAQLVTEESIFNFEMAGFYQKYMADIRDAQREDGSIPDVVPTYWSLYPADPAWGTACVVIPWYTYLYYNDKRILKENYSLIKGWVNFLKTKEREGIIQFDKYADWCPPWHVYSVDTPGSLVSTWYYYHDTLILARIARVLGYKKEAADYKERADEILTAFNQEFLEEDAYTSKQEEWYYESMVPENVSGIEREKSKENARKTFAIESQTSNVLPLYLDMVPSEKEDKILETLLHDITVIHNNHLNTGIVGTRYIMEVLTEYGHTDLAFKLATQTTYPSWGYMIEEGATTLWERWEYLADQGMNSHNHIMLGSVDTWFYKVLAGINIKHSSPGFKEFIIKPHPVDKLDTVSASLNTVQGLVSSKWNNDDKSFNLKVKIPANTTATIYLPKLDFEDIVVSESGNIIWKFNSYREGVNGIQKGSEKDDYIIFDVGSGEYLFTVTEYPANI